MIAIVAFTLGFICGVGVTLVGEDAAGWIVGKINSFVDKEGA
jgi:hypothetical protein